MLQQWPRFRDCMCAEDKAKPLCGHDQHVIYLAECQFGFHYSDWWPLACACGSGLQMRPIGEYFVLGNQEQAGTYSRDKCTVVGARRVYAREDMPEELCLMNIWMPVVSSIIYTTQLELGNFKLMRADGPRGRRT